MFVLGTLPLPLRARYINKRRVARIPLGVISRLSPVLDRRFETMICHQPCTWRAIHQRAVTLELQSGER